jgi:hypothetical protein
MSNTAAVNTVTQWLNYVMAIPFLVLGIIGAILTVIIFTRQRLFWRNASITYLLAGATMTGIHLPLIYTQSILVHGFGLGIFNSNNMACREHNYLLYMTTVAAISFPCWAAFDQYASTSRNARFRNHWSSIRVVRWAIIGTVIFWSIAYLPIIFVSGIVDGACVLQKGVYTRLSNYFLTPLVYSVGPLTIMTIFTFGTIRNLRSIQGIQRQDHLTKQVRRMLIPQLIVLGISGIPFGFEGIYLELTNGIEKDDFRLALETFFSQLILLLFHCNYVCPFYIYLYMSSEVRKDFKNLILKCIGNNEVVPVVQTIQTGAQQLTLNTLHHSVRREIIDEPKTPIPLNAIHIQK